MVHGQPQDHHRPGDRPAGFRQPADSRPERPSELPGGFGTHPVRLAEGLDHRLRAVNSILKQVHGFVHSTVHESSPFGVKVTLAVDRFFMIINFYNIESNDFFRCVISKKSIGGALMEIRQLRSFRSVAELMSFHKAAEQLHYAPIEHLRTDQGPGGRA